MGSLERFLCPVPYPSRKESTLSRFGGYFQPLEEQCHGSWLIGSKSWELVVQWLRLSLPMMGGGRGFDPGLGAEIPHGSGQKNQIRTETVL